MFHPLLPVSVKKLSESSSIELAQAIQYQIIETSLEAELLFTAYTCQGRGDPPLVLLHGFDSSQLEFRFLLPHLTPYRETWTIDLLGFGFSPHPGTISINPLHIKTALYEFWKTMIARPIVLVGASMGGATAMDFTLTYPHVVEKLVLIDSTGYTNTPDFVKFLIPPLDQMGVMYLRWRKLSAIKFSQLLGVSSHWLDLLYCATLHQEMPGWEKGILEFNQSGGYRFLPSSIPTIQQPTLILWGEQDDMLGRADAHQFADSIANSQLVWIANAGHAPHIEQPQATAQHICSFLDPSSSQPTKR